jgi:hypothetical protein
VEEAMIEKPPAPHIAEADLMSLPVDPPQIDTPVIDFQDLEHKPGPETRVSNKGMKIEPGEFAKEDEAALQALEEFEKSRKGHLPG